MKRFLVAILFALSLGAADRQILLIAGLPSHPPLQHEHNAGVLLLTKWLNTVPGIKATAQLNGWPKDSSKLESADSIFIFCDGGQKHLATQGDHAAELDKAARRGAGFVFHHYAVEPPTDRGMPQFLNWIGGAFEQHYSVNPHWDAEFSRLPKHPITSGVKPFTLRDEWYYNIRFREGMQGITPILTAIPPASTLSRPDGPHSGNPKVRTMAGQPQHVMWTVEREDGGRGVGFTGGHFHLNLGDEHFRKLLLNALVWSAKGKVPKNGVTVNVTKDELMQNLDPKPAQN